MGLNEIYMAKLMAGISAGDGWLRPGFDSVHGRMITVEIMTDPN